MAPNNVFIYPDITAARIGCRFDTIAVQRGELNLIRRDGSIATTIGTARRLSGGRYRVTLR